MRKIKNYFLKQKIVLIICAILLLLLIIFPIKTNDSNYIINDIRENYIVGANKNLEQQFIIRDNNLKKISLLLSTENYNIDCKLKSELYDKNNNLIGKAEINNKQLSESVELFDIFVISNLKTKSNELFKVVFNTNCDNLVKIQLYESHENDIKAIYDSTEINKSVVVKYSVEKKSKNNIYYSIAIIIISLLFIVTGGSGNNGKK